MPFSPSTSQVRLWICRRDSFISCLASRSASWLRLAASERSANCEDHGGGVRAAGASRPLPVSPPMSPGTFDLYHSSASCRFFTAMLSYWVRMSRSAAVRSGWRSSTCTSACWLCALTSRSRSSWGATARGRSFRHPPIPPPSPPHGPGPYLLVQLLQEADLVHQQLNFALQLQAGQRGVIHVLQGESRLSRGEYKRNGTPRTPTMSPPPLVCAARGAPGASPRLCTEAQGCVGCVGAGDPHPLTLRNSTRLFSASSRFCISSSSLGGSSGEKEGGGRGADPPP